MFITVKNASYARVIESLLNSIINSFIVDTQHDLKVMNEITSRCNGQAIPTFRYDNKAFDYRAGESAREYLTVLRAIENPVVLRILILNSRIEQVILVQDKQEGNRITSNGYPENCRSVMTKDCFNMGHRLGGLSTVAIFEYRGPLRIETDTSHLIIDETDKLEAIKAEIQSHRDNGQDFEGKIEVLNQQINDLNSGAMNYDITQLSERSLECQRQLDFDAKANANILEESLQTCIDQLKITEDMIQEVVSKRRAVQKQEHEVKSALNQARKEIDQHAAKKLIGVGIENDKAKHAFQCRQDGEHWSKKLDAMSMEYEQAYAEMAQANAVLESQIRDMTSICARINTTRSSASITNQIRKLDADLKEQAANFGDRDEVFQKYSEKKEAYKSAKKEIKGSLVLIEMLTESLQDRNDMWLRLRSYVSSSAELNFSELMRRRGYQGRIILRHSAETLELKVATTTKELEQYGEDGDEAIGRDAKTLSGGEKSFSTICLLLSLWESISSPFRALDEFDVFMDAINRKMSMKMLIENARMNDKMCQYIFITPQDMSSMNAFKGKDLRIFRMQDPERGQTTLT